MGFYDPATQELLPAVQPATGDALPDLVTVDVLQVGDLPPLPRPAFSPPAMLGDAVQLLRAGWRADDGAWLPALSTVAPGSTLTLQIHWQAREWIATDYTVFVHLVGPDGTLVTQADKQPLDGALPTSTWSPGQRVVDTFTLVLPPDVLPGEYTVVTGFYDLATGTRLPVTQGDTALGDAFSLGTFTVQ